MTIENDVSSRGRWCALVFGCALFALPSSAFAQTSANDSARGAARKLGYDGVSAYQNGDLEVASSKLEKAYQVYPTPSLALWSARVRRDQGKWVEASERYLDCTRKPPGDGGDRQVQLNSQDECRAEREILDPKIPLLTVEIRGEGIESFSFTINDVVQSSALAGTEIPANPGTVRVHGVSDGREAQVDVELLEGASGFVVLDFGQRPSIIRTDLPPGNELASSGQTASALDADRSSSKRAWQRPVGWTGIGVGSAGVLVGAVAGLLALGQQKDLGCDEGKCEQGTDKDLVDNLNSMRIVSSIGFIAGGVLAAGGVTLLLTSPKASSKVSLQPYLNSASLGVAGSF